MKYFRTCPRCGSHLDPGEKCDCQKRREEHVGERKENRNETKDRKIRS